MEYQIHAALESHSRQAYFWTTEEIANFHGLVKVSCNNKSVILAYRYIDQNFTIIYNRTMNTIPLTSNSVIIEDYYRAILKIRTRSIADLFVEQVKWYNIKSKLKYLYNNVNENTRLTFWLAFLSIILSLIGLLFNIFPCLTHMNK